MATSKNKKKQKKNKKRDSINSIFNTEEYAEFLMAANGQNKKPRH